MPRRWPIRRRPSPPLWPSPIGTPPLAELARGPQERLHPHLRHHPAGAEPPDPAADAADARRAGHPREEILILVATGLHRPNEGAELEEMVGPEIVRALSHREPLRQSLGDHDFLGTTPERRARLDRPRYFRPT